MALWLKRWGYSPEQVQDFYPTPGTISTVMYYTGINPMTGKSVYVCSDYREKQLQRALLQYSKPQNANLVREALAIAGREDLIGNGPDCLVRAAFGKSGGSNQHRAKGTRGSARIDRGNGATATPKKTKLGRVFGEDYVKILKRADKLAGGDLAKKISKSNKKTGKSSLGLSKPTKVVKKSGKKR